MNCEFYIMNYITFTLMYLYAICNCFRFQSDICGFISTAHEVGKSRGLSILICRLSDLLSCTSW